MPRTKPHLLGLLLLASCLSPGLAGDLSVDYLYNLSDFSGTIPYGSVRMHTDRDNGEAYVLAANVTRIFNASGMEVFSFGNADEGGSILDLTVDESGRIYTLSHRIRPAAGQAPFWVRQRNYRGEPQATIEVADDSPALSGFLPVRIFHRQDRLLLVDPSRMLAVETDLQGAVREVHDIAAMLALPDQDRPDVEITGFDLDRTGNMLLTVAVLFRAFVISPDGTVRSFGQGGSVPGTFGIVAGITTDDHGRYYVADKLHNVVMVFDSNFEFITEFGYRGTKPGNLIVPHGLVVDGSGKLYVSQQRNRGVAVFSVTGGERQDRSSVQEGEQKEVSARLAGEDWNDRNDPVRS